jgi:hypothetical protein
MTKSDIDSQTGPEVGLDINLLSIELTPTSSVRGD